MERALIRVDGRVQGVGFRWWVQSQSRTLGVVGYAENLPDGRVEVSAQGDRIAVGRMIRRLIEEPSIYGRPGKVVNFKVEWAAPESNRRGFSVY